jgi:putative Flp pilus-assembly TadE/G-like protein
MKVSGKFRRDRGRERGVTMVLVALAMVAIIAMAAMSIDLVTLYLAREEAQRAADSAALGAARVISVSGITGSGSPGSNLSWGAICGPTTGWATEAAQSAVAQNTVGGQTVTSTVTYSDGSTSGPDCSALSDAFAVNPLVTVQVMPVSIPSFFSRIWGRAGSTISASSTAEVFNPSGSNSTGISPNGNVTPVEPRGVKPWIVPNLDPGNCTSTNETVCQPFVDPASGQIKNQGIAPGGLLNSPGVIGESFYLFADCGPNPTSCALVDPVPVANRTGGTFIGGTPATPNLEYLPGSAPATVSAVPSCASGTNYQQAVAGFDQTTVYQCGQQVALAGNPNTIDLNENPGGGNGDTALGLACSLTAPPKGSQVIPLNGQDMLQTSGYPFVAIAGSANPLGINGAPITSSNSIVSLPIYDGGTLILAGNKTAPVNIVGFLQVFVNQVYTNGSINVTVLNVAGCGSSATTNPPVFGSSPLPVRLIQPH